MVVVYNGDLDEMAKTTSDLTWFEDICLLEEVLWGRGEHRWSDVAKNMV